MAHWRAATLRVRSAARRRAVSANTSPHLHHSLPNRYSPSDSSPVFSSMNVSRGRAPRKLIIHGDLVNQNAPCFSVWWCASQRCRFSSSTPASGSPSADSTSTETISVTFVDKHGDEKTIKVPLGMSMLEAAHQNDIELEGACEGSIACSTCHVIVMDDKYYNKLPEPSDEENDMLDLAFGLTETSRLGCQVVAKPELDGMRLAIPSATRNFAVDGYVPKPH